MIDPISVGLALLIAAAKEAATSEIAKAAYSGIIGNRADVFFISSINKIKEIISFRNQNLPENHDLLRTLRKAMLTSTDMLRLSMKEDGEQKQFRKLLKSWIDEQIMLLPSLSKWNDWNNPAAEKLELFFADGKNYKTKKLQLIQSMTESWVKYLEVQLNLELPKEFIDKLRQGWYEDEKLITWYEATMVLMIEALRNTKDEMGLRASKAFEHNFLSDIKLKLSDIEKQMLSQYPNRKLINKLSTTIFSQQKTIQSQQDSIEGLVKIQSNSLKNSLYLIRRELTELGIKYDYCLEKVNELISVNRSEAKDMLIQSANVLNNIIHLYESSRLFISAENRNKLDLLLKRVRDDNPLNTNDQLTFLIEFVQQFDNTVNWELENN